MLIKQKLEHYLKINFKKTTLFEKKLNYETYEECTYVGRNFSITNYINDNKNEETFQTKLFNYIDSKNLKDSDVYNKVYIDRKLFSKIRSNKNYHPSKNTVILLGLSLELTENEIEDLLSSASYSLPKNTIYDLIIRFCFKEKIYDINKVNEFLYEHDCKTLT